MNAPGVAHETRRVLLDDTATLAGLTEPFRLGVGLIPDVARQDSSGRRVLVGDAKDTESPGCAATQRRLRTYALALIADVSGGCRVRLALALPACDSVQLALWLGTLRRATRAFGGVREGAAEIDSSTTFVWLDLELDCQRPNDTRVVRRRLGSSRVTTSTGWTA